MDSKPGLGDDFALLKGILDLAEPDREQKRVPYAIIAQLVNLCAQAQDRQEVGDDCKS